MPRREIILNRWADVDAWKSGTASGVSVEVSGLVFDRPVEQVDQYEAATWTSPLTPVGFPATELIPSWTATTPGSSFVRIELRAADASGRTTKWYNLGDWAADDSAFTRTSLKGQDDEDGVVEADILKAAEGRRWESMQARVTLLRPAGSEDVPSVQALYAVASAVPTESEPSHPQTAMGVVLEVPAHSQLIHQGGHALCSAASTAMVLSYWGTGPGPADYAWVDPSYPDPWVDHAARHIYDRSFSGCGNWPFNTAYAGRFGVRGFVTRLRSLNEAELFIAAGIPLIASSSYAAGEVPGLDYTTDGHLVVLAGFTAEGDPVLNDPNAPANDGVRKRVGRKEWEAAWLRSSRGVVYVIHPASVRLPTPQPQANW